MAYNAVAFKKSMLIWDAVAKKAPGQIAQEAKALGGDQPAVAKQVSAWTDQITTLNHKIHDLLDGVINAHDDKGRVEAEKKALNEVKQYQGYVASSHLPPASQTLLKNGLAELTKALS